jgi:hypothetical protein
MDDLVRGDKPLKRPRASMEALLMGADVGYKS